MGPDAHADRIEQAFSLQARAFEDARANQVFTSDAAWITEFVDCAEGDLVLDVAAGTGHAARQLAPRVRSVIALDQTAAMLEQGQAAAAREGLENVVFCRGSAEALPFLDGSFDTVVCRFAFHHFERPEAVLAEMVRCLRPEGQLVVADLIAHPDPDAAQRQNRLEVLRDPSHTKLLGQAELIEMIARLRSGPVEGDVRAVERPLEPWLAQTDTPAAVADEIRAELQAELAGGSASGFAPRAADDGTLWFTQTFQVLVRR